MQDYKMLRCFVYLMGIAMICGMVVISYAVVKIASIGTSCSSDLQLKLEEGEEIISIGEKFVYVLDKGKIKQYSSCNGDLVRVIELYKKDQD